MKTKAGSMKMVFLKDTKADDHVLVYTGEVSGYEGLLIFRCKGDKLYAVTLTVMNDQSFDARMKDDDGWSYIKYGKPNDNTEQDGITVSGWNVGGTMISVGKFKSKNAETGADDYATSTVYINVSVLEKQSKPGSRQEINHLMSGILLKESALSLSIFAGVDTSVKAFESEKLLKERALRIDGHPYSVVSIKDCQEAALLGGISTIDAEILALSTGICPMRYERNIGTFGFDGQKRLLESSAAVVGLGGLGGLITELLARAGVGRLVLADGDVFSESNLNRQLLCNESVWAGVRLKLQRGVLTQLMEP